jgi:hypothetical protein
MKKPTSRARASLRLGVSGGGLQAWTRPSNEDTRQGWQNDQL